MSIVVGGGARARLIGRVRFLCARNPRKPSGEGLNSAFNVRGVRSEKILYVYELSVRDTIYIYLINYRSIFFPREFLSSFSSTESRNSTFLPRQTFCFSNVDNDFAIVNLDQYNVYGLYTPIDYSYGILVTT